MALAKLLSDNDLNGKIQNNLNEDIGRLIKQARKEIRVSQAMLAQRTNLRRASISEIENGRKHIDVSTLLLLAEALERPLAYFLPEYVRENILLERNFSEQNVLSPTRWTGVSTAGHRWEVHQGDALRILAELPKRTIDCVVTSPPYYWQRDYSVDNQIGQEATVDGYINNIVKTMDNIYELLKPEGTVFLNIGDTYYSGKGEAQGKDLKNRRRRFGLRAVDASGGLGIGLMRKSLIGIPWRVALALLERKWVLRSSIIWVNDVRIPETVKDRPSQSYEYIFMLVKSRRYSFNQEVLKDSCSTNVWHTSSRAQVPKHIDTAPFPDEIVQRCLAVGCPPSGTVLDPFAGSGTTLRVALNTSRSATGIELNPTTCAYIVNQLQKL